MLLTAAQHRDIARRAQWYFDVYFGPPGDSVVFTGDGLDDLNQLIDRLNGNTVNNHMLDQKFRCDVGTQYSDWRPFDVQDVVAIRSLFISFHGSVDKPDAYAANSNSALTTEVSTEFGGSSPQVAL